MKKKVTVAKNNTEVKQKKERRDFLNVAAKFAGILATLGITSEAWSTMDQKQKKLTQVQKQKKIITPQTPVFEHSKYPGGEQLIEKSPVNADKRSLIKNITSNITQDIEEKVNMAYSRLYLSTNEFILKISGVKPANQIKNIDQIYTQISKETGLTPELVHKIHAMSYRSMEYNILRKNKIKRGMSPLAM